VERVEIAIVGAGPAGLATAALLRRAGRNPVLLEAGPEPGAAWPERYERLRLHTPRLLSGLPERRIPRRYGRWVRRDDLIAYFREYAEAEGLDVRTGVRVERLDPAEDRGWLLRSSAGPFLAQHAVVATGYNGASRMPEWPGRDGFSGELLHSSQYRNAGPYRGRDVLVVGAGNSGAEIATDLTEGGAARVRLSVRTPPQIVRRATAGIPAQVLGMAIRKLPPSWADPVSKTIRRVAIPDLAPYGLPRPEHGVRTAFLATGTVPILDVGIVAAIQRGAVEVVAAVEGFEGAEVLLADGSRIRPDTVIAATGFRPGLEPLVAHLGVLGPRGLPLITDGEPALPGLWFVGFVPTLGGQLRDGSRAARTVAAALAAYTGERRGVAQSG
jgi:putative flavoprotein involved in K+ transport